MAISGLVITLDERAEGAAAAMAHLSREPRLTLGERFGPRLAAVAETPSPAGDRALVDELLAITGIVSVDVAFVSVEAGEEPQE